MTLTSLKQLIGEGDKVWCLAARVEVHTGQSLHYEKTAEGAMMISVQTLRHDVEIWALLKGGAVGIGMWFIPPVGTEVLISFDDGEFEGDAYIVGIHGHSPDDLTPDKILIIGETVNVQATTVNIQATEVNMCDADNTPAVGDGVLNGKAIDPFTGSTHNVLGNASTKVFAKK